MALEEILKYLMPVEIYDSGLAFSTLPVNSSSSIIQNPIY